MSRKGLTTEERARQSAKVIGLTLAQIEREITDSGRLTFDYEVKVKGTQTVVRIVVRVRAPHLEQWAISVVLVGNGRIDGIDWEAVVKDHRGKQHNCSGWHRHVWKPQGGDIHKECLPQFKPERTARSFIVEGFRELNI